MTFDHELPARHPRPQPLGEPQVPLQAHPGGALSLDDEEVAQRRGAPPVAHRERRDLPLGELSEAVGRHPRELERARRRGPQRERDDVAHATALSVMILRSGKWCGPSLPP